MKASPSTLLVSALCVVLLTACAPAAPSATPIPTVTFTPTIPPTKTPSPTPVPPTATITPIPIVLTDGTHQWIIKSVTVSETSKYSPPSGFYLVAGFVYLTIEFENSDGGDIVSAILGLGDAGVFIKFSLPGGIKMVYVTDDQNQKFNAVEVAQTYFIIPVSKDSSGFTLYVQDWDPVELGR
jgi:hypothetical protein